MRKCSQVADTSKTEEQLQHVYTQYIIAGVDPGGQGHHRHLSVQLAAENLPLNS